MHLLLHVVLFSTLIASFARCQVEHEVDGKPVQSQRTAQSDLDHLRGAVELSTEKESLPPPEITTQKVEVSTPQDVTHQPEISTKAVKTETVPDIDRNRIETHLGDPNATNVDHVILDQKSNVVQKVVENTKNNVDETLIPEPTNPPPTGEPKSTTESSAEVERVTTISPTGDVKSETPPKSSSSFGRTLLVIVISAGVVTFIVYVVIKRRQKQHHHQQLYDTENGAGESERLTEYRSMGDLLNDNDNRPSYDKYH